MHGATTGSVEDRPGGSGSSAISWRDHTLTPRDLQAAVEHVRSALVDESLKPGERVAVIAPNVPALVVALLAIWREGAVAVPMSARLREFDLATLLRDSDAGLVLAVESYQGYSFRDLLPRLLPQLGAVRRCLFLDPLGPVTARAGDESGRPAAEALDPEIALILYTSGSTGVPKGALTTHDSLRSGAAAMSDLLDLGAGDTCALVVSLSHAFGLGCLLAALRAGSHAVLVDSTRSIEPLIADVERFRATVVHGSPTVFNSLLKSAPERARSLRTGFVAGSPCPAEVMARLDDQGMRLLNLYGMTEIGAAVCSRRDDPTEVRHSTLGRPLPGFDLRIDAASGEVQVCGPQVTPGYWRNPAETEAALCGRWFRTGDLGSVDEEGNLRLHGRAKEMVKVAGFNVAPSEIEAFLLTHPDVLQAVVVAVPHDTLGEALEAFVVARPGTAVGASEILQFARPRIAGYKLPYRLHVVEEIPHLATGKPDRQALRATMAGQQVNGTKPAGRR